MSVDLLLQLRMGAAIERAKRPAALAKAQRWAPGEPLKLLFAGYNGNRNTGADVRVEEMLRQVRAVLGDAAVEASVFTYRPFLSRGYFKGAFQIALPGWFPPALVQEVEQHHGVVACEGSMFKSNFGNALTTMMVGALGLAAAQGKLAVGYGAEAGKMDPVVRALVQRYCRGVYVLTRNVESREVLSQLGIESELGTDTAWTFEPAPRAYADQALTAAGWDGTTPVLGICPMNPFWFPIRPSLWKHALRKGFGALQESHARDMYFHADGADRRASYERYLAGISGAVKAFRQTRAVFPVVIGMEALDRRACEALAERLGGVPTFVSDRHTMFELVALLRRCGLLVSSRYHGVVTSMPALVPSVGLAIDERIRNLMRERGQSDLAVDASDEALEPKLLAGLERCWTDADAVKAGIARTVVENLHRMAQMGKGFLQHVRARHPELAARDDHRSWEDYLPPLAPGLKALLAQHGPAPGRLTGS